MGDSTPNTPSTLFGFVNSTFGKVTFLITFVTTIVTALKLFRGDSRLAIIVVFIVGTSSLLIGSLYVILKKKEVRTATFKTGMTVKKEFAYSRLKRSAALGILVIVVITWGVAVFYKKHTPLGVVRGIDVLAGKKVTVEGFVFTAGGQPADKAMVTLTFNGMAKETQEAVSGKFSFTDLDASQFGPGGMVVDAQWRTLHAQLPVNPSTDQLTNLIIKLPAGPAPFTVEYFVLEGPAIDLLLQGQIEKRWAEKLGGKPSIVENDVFNELQALINRFSSPFVYEVLEVSRSKNRAKSPSMEREAASAYKNKLFFLGGSKDDSLDHALTRDEFATLLNPAQKWHLSVVPYRESGPGVEALLPGITANSLFFWRFATPDDVNMVLRENAAGVGFYRYITGNHLPPDFFLFTMNLNIGASSGSGCGDNRTAVNLKTRSLKLRIALLENISEHAIRIGKFSLKRNPLNRLRSHDEDLSMLAGKSFEQKTYVPSEILNPKEKLVIPIELLLAYGADENRREGRYTRGTPDEAITELTKVNQVNLPVGRRISGKRTEQSLPVETAVLLNMIKMPTENPNLKKEFVFGPSEKVESIYVDGVNYPFRPLDSTVLVMKGDTRGSSCPFIFTFSPEDNLWINEGTILTNFDSKWKESTDEKSLTRFHGSLLIQERDPETSFIDQLYVRALNHDGSEKILTPKNYELRRADRNYLVLRQGEQKRISFELPQGVGAKEFILVAKGYYIPYRK